MALTTPMSDLTFLFILLVLILIIKLVNIGKQGVEYKNLWYSKARKNVLRSV